ncbi:hypothetical protein B0H15DRAFT_856737 [Mycena belliarum]|uniref:Uncharacterized protein n=1 Tax=Mycena belliarum TaxID=1033014 RepID=A0AAD6XMH0_9AGAR|nr:hypothetical protein B0H15DRAFT_856737 [Mycena belliae]
MSLPQVTSHPESFYAYAQQHLQGHFVRRVQSWHSALGASDAYRSPHTGANFSFATSSRSPMAQPRLGPVSVVEFDLRQPMGGQINDYPDDGASSGSEPPSASDPVFSPKHLSHLSSSPQKIHEPLSRSASELDLRLLNQLSQYRYPALDTHGRETRTAYSVSAPHFGFHSPAASIHSLNDLSSPRSHRHDTESACVPQICGELGSPWDEAQGQHVTVRQVELMYPSPVTPISLRSDAFDAFAHAEKFRRYEMAAEPTAMPPGEHKKYEVAFNL